MTTPPDDSPWGGPAVARALPQVLECEPRRLHKVTFDGPTSLVELRLSPDGDSGTPTPD
jgi:hypothetical protein